MMALEKKSGIIMCRYPSSVGPGGLEPPTSSLSGMRSNQLSYGPDPYAFESAQSTSLPVNPHMSIGVSHADFA